jgi:predicted transcriptional regulator
MTTPLNTVNSHFKDKLFNSEKQTVYLYLNKHIATAAMIAAATNIPHKNICRYKRKLEKEGLLQTFKKGYCKITGYKAFYLTTNCQLFQTPNNKGGSYGK